MRQVLQHDQITLAERRAGFAPPSRPLPPVAARLLRNQNSATWRVRTDAVAIHNSASVETRAPGVGPIPFHNNANLAWPAQCRLALSSALDLRRRDTGGSCARTGCCTTVGRESLACDRAHSLSPRPFRATHALVWNHRRRTDLPPSLDDRAPRLQRTQRCSRRSVATREWLGSSASAHPSTVTRALHLSTDRPITARCLGTHWPSMGPVDRGLPALAIGPAMAPAHRALCARTHHLHFRASHPAPGLQRLRDRAGARPPQPEKRGTR